MAIKIQHKRGIKTLTDAATGAISELFFDTTNNVFWVAIENGTGKQAVNKAFTSAGAPTENGVTGAIYVDTTNNVLYYCSGASTFTKVSLKLDDGTTAATSTWSSQKIQQVITAASWGVGEFQDSVKDKDLNDPPVGPSNGDRYIVGGTPTGAWVGHALAIAEYVTSAWEFQAATEGTCTYVDDEDLLYIYSGAAWVAMGSSTLSSSEPGAVADGSSGSAGVASTAARGDHNHDLSIAANYVTLAMQAHGTHGGIVYYTTGGAPAELAVGTIGQVLKSGGADANLSWYTLDHDDLADKGSNTHSTIDTFLGSKAQASGLASLDGSSLVVQNPANATATATASKIPIADGNGALNTWITEVDGGALS